MLKSTQLTVSPKNAFSTSTIPPAIKVLSFVPKISKVPVLFFLLDDLLIGFLSSFPAALFSP